MIMGILAKQHTMVIVVPLAKFPTANGHGLMMTH